MLKKMNARDYHVSLTVPATPIAAFNAINRVTEWWTKNLEGKSAKLNDEFTVRFDDMHTSTQKLVEVVPGEKVIWLVTESRLSFVKNKTEWTGTKIYFGISAKNGKTQIAFTHAGLEPGLECFGDCSEGWNQYIKGSLYNLLTKGQGEPEPKKAPKKEKNTRSD